MSKPARFLVFHRKRLWVLPLSKPMPPDVMGWQSGYTLAAVVEGRSYQEAWEKTQHTDGNWQDNPGVSAMVSNPRSTSVGDVIARVSPSKTELMLVADVGFQPFAPVSPRLTCFVCGQPADDKNAAWFHEPACDPNLGDHCDCYLYAHFACFKGRRKRHKVLCPVCGEN